MGITPVGFASFFSELTIAFESTSLTSFGRGMQLAVQVAEDFTAFAVDPYWVDPGLRISAKDACVIAQDLVESIESSTKVTDAEASVLSNKKQLSDESDDGFTGAIELGVSFDSRRDVACALVCLVLFLVLVS